METFERIRLLRKNQLKLSQEQFGEKLGVSRSVIANIETNVLARPEQKEPLLRLICESFHVRYEWLTTGQGDMFVVTKQSFLEKLSAEYGLSFTAQKIVECYLGLKDEQRATVDSFFQSIAESLVEPSAEKEGAGVADEVIDKKTEIYRAADSDTHTEHEVIKDGKATVDKLKQIPPVTDKKNF